MNRLTKLVILFTITLSLGCKKDDPKPVAPIITFLDARLSPDKTFSIVRFEFFDGDGDLGLSQNENTGEQEFNLFVNYYERINGVWTLKSPIVTWNPADAVYDTVDLHLRIPLLENEAKRALEGETEVNLLYNFSIDTFRYEIILKDRAFNLSNVITTSDLIVN